LPHARIQYHKTFAEPIKRSKTSTGTLIVNDRGELLDFVLAPGNVKPIPKLACRLFLGDKGYLSNEMNSFNVQLITGIRANIAHAAAR
jgi:hypothetical protein